jgi:hypothetical protein
MSPGNTQTGGVLERMVLPALDHAGYAYKTQVDVGERLGCGRHVVDAVVSKEGRQFLVSVKWQQVSGTAEQKVPFEVICLIEALGMGEYEKAYVVLGGEGWKLRDFYTKGGLIKYLTTPERVEILTLEAFIARANQGRL